MTIRRQPEWPEILGIFFCGCLFVMAAFVVGFAICAGLIILVTNVLLPLFDVHYELTWKQAGAGALILMIVKGLLGSTVTVNRK